MAIARAPLRKIPSRVAPKLRRSDLQLHTSYVEPLANNELRVSEIWAEVLNIDRVGSQDDYFDLGGDSLKATELFLEIERWFGIRMATSEILEHPTVAKLATLLASRSQTEVNRCLLHLQPEGVGPPLFVLHDMSGGVMSYRHVLRRLGNRRKIFGLQYPGWDNTATSVLSFPALAAVFADAMREAWPKGPYYLAGYSLGAQLAFATANQLLATGAEVGLLVLLDGATRTGKVRGFRREVRKLARGLFHLADVEVGRWPAYLLNNGAREMRRILKKDRRRQQEERPPNFASLIDGQAGDYVPPIYPAPVKMLRSTDQDEYFNRKYLGWDEYVSGPIEVFDVSAHHGNLMAEPRAALVSAYLENWMGEADRARRSR